MGVITGHPIDFDKLIEMSDSIIKKDDFFNGVYTLEQSDLDKGSKSVFDFKFKKDGTWYLGSFYRSVVTNKLTLSISKFV